MKSFEDMSLPMQLNKALTALKFVQPTEIQSSVIPIAVEGKDLIACAETGSGKTAAYAIPAVIELLKDKDKHALVLAPTRELAQQIADFFRDLTKFCDGLSVTALIGGADIYKQFRSLKKNPRILVATPGRLNDHLHRKSLSLTSTGILILDEGDRMLDMGFAPQLDEILKYLPKKRQTSLFTATLPPKVKTLAEKYLSKPEQVNVGRVSLPVASITQSVIEVTNKEKEDKLVDELNKRENSIIIFAKTKIKTDKLYRMIKDYGFEVDLIHGDRTQGQRNRAIANLRAGRCRILVATDVAARGIDIPHVAHVINYDLPMMLEDYVHRIGRTARNGATGEALSFITPEDYRTWAMIAKKYQITGIELKNKKSASSGGRSEGRGERSRSGGGFKGRSEGGRSRFSSGRSSEGRTNSFGYKVDKEDRKERFSSRPDADGEGRRERFGARASAEGRSENREGFSKKRSFEDRGERPSFGFKKDKDQGFKSKFSTRSKFDDDSRDFKKKSFGESRPFDRDIEEAREEFSKKRFKSGNHFEKMAEGASAKKSTKKFSTSSGSAFKKPFGKKKFKAPFSGGGKKSSSFGSSKSF